MKLSEYPADPRGCRERLTASSNCCGGGPDTVTVVVADVVDYDYGQTQPIWPGRSQATTTN